MPYAINGHDLTEPKDMAPGMGIFATGPERHSIEPAPISVVQTVGGAIAVEPPTGLIRIHEWQFGERTAEAVRAIKSYMAGSPLCYIDTYDVEADPLSPTKSMRQLTNILCVGTLTTVSSAGQRDRVDSMSIRWQEVYPQTGL